MDTFAPEPLGVVDILVQHESIAATDKGLAARLLKLSACKGCIAVGAGADLVAWTRDLCPRTVPARGKLMMRDGELLVKGLFEQ